MIGLYRYGAVGNVPAHSYMPARVSAAGTNSRRNAGVDGLEGAGLIRANNPN